LEAPFLSSKSRISRELERLLNESQDRDHLLHLAPYGRNSKLIADLEWTFPLEFLELVWGDGTRVERQIISAADVPAFGKKHFELPFDAAGKSWIRFSAWDSAGNGAFLQPVWLAK
jgi:hypothetical protein